MKISEHTKHILALAGVGVLVIGATLAVYIKQQNTGTDLGVDPNSLKGVGFGGGAVKSLLAALGAGLGTQPTNNGYPDPNLPLPSADQFNTGGGTDLSMVDNTQPAPTVTSMVSQANDTSAAVAPVSQPAVLNTWTPVNTGSSYWDTTPSYDNGLIIPAGSTLVTGQTLTSDQVLTPVVGGQGNLAQDQYGNYYQTSLPPTSGPGTQISPTDTTPIGGTWNPALGHDPGNPYDTN